MLMPRLDYGLLQNASEKMIRLPRSDAYMKWVCRYVAARLKPTHVSIALTAPDSHKIAVRFSEGERRIPPRLICLCPGSPLVRWFQKDDQPGVPHPSRRLLARPRRGAKARERSDRAIREMELHGAEICVKIETSERTAGYLLVGPPRDKPVYNREELSLFRVLANDIAVEIEKEEYFFSSRVDALTGVFNRQSLPGCLDLALQKARRQGIGLALALVDFDDFKAVNDRYGHLVGDQLLKIGAARIRSRLRKSDLIFRYGGDEFLLVLPFLPRDATRGLSFAAFRRGVSRCAGRLLAAFREPVQCLTHRLSVSVSVGLCFWNGSSRSTPESLIAAADRALYRAKRAGKGRAE